LFHDSSDSPSVIEGSSLNIKSRHLPNTDKLVVSLALVQPQPDHSRSSIFLSRAVSWSSRSSPSPAKKNQNSCIRNIAKHLIIGRSRRPGKELKRIKRSNTFCNQMFKSRCDTSLSARFCTEPPAVSAIITSLNFSTYGSCTSSKPNHRCEATAHTV
jgi:hypothetical protein